MSEKQLVIPTAIVFGLMVFWLISTDSVAVPPGAVQSVEPRQVAPDINLKENNAGRKLASLSMT
jgi:hypothetical protein